MPCISVESKGKQENRKLKWKTHRAVCEMWKTCFEFLNSCLFPLVLCLVFFFWLQHGSSGFSHFSSSSPPLLHITVPVAYYRGNHMHTCFHKRFSFFLSVSVVLLPISFIKKKKLAKQSPRQQAAVVQSCRSIEARHIYARCCTFWVAGTRQQSI